MHPNRSYKVSFCVSLCVALTLCMGLVYVATNESHHFKSSILETNQSSSNQYHTTHPWLKSSDLIYNNDRNTVPIVNEEYNIVFFLKAKVASTEFIRFFSRLQNNPNWCKTDIHNSNVHQLTFLNDYSIDQAQAIMTNPKWKKVMFVRHPKARLLSAFLDKAKQYSERFVDEYCNTYERLKPNSFQDCVDNHEDFDYFVREITTTLDKDVHWRTIYSSIDEKWWPYISNFGYMDTLRDDAELILSSVYSNVDGVSAWDRISSYGWSGVKTNESCQDNLRSDSPFLGKGDIFHTTSANDKLKSYYSRELEAFVDERYADDLQNPFFHFGKVTLFPMIHDDEERMSTKILKEKDNNED